MYTRARFECNFLAQGWATSEVNQNEGPQNCAHVKFYYNKVIWYQTYTVLINVYNSFYLS